MLAGSTIFMNK